MLDRRDLRGGPAGGLVIFGVEGVVSEDSIDFVKDGIVEG